MIIQTLLFVCLVVNPNIEDQRYLFILVSIKKKINIVKIKTNSQEIHYETCRHTILKTRWERIFLLYDTKKVEDENPILKKCLEYAYVRVHFQIFIIVVTFLAL